jgi:hypothetical protein
MIDVLELTLVLELAIFINSFLEWLELETVLPDEELKYHADVQLVLQVERLIYL